MNSNCPNCKSSITCGCQRRRASDGTQCCTRCIAVYEQGHRNSHPQAQPVFPKRPAPNPNWPGHHHNTAPSNVHAFYNPMKIN